MSDSPASHLVSGIDVCHCSLCRGAVTAAGAWGCGVCGVEWSGGALCRERGEGVGPAARCAALRLGVVPAGDHRWFQIKAICDEWMSGL